MVVAGPHIPTTPRHLKPITEDCMSSNLIYDSLVSINIPKNLHYVNRYFKYILSMSEVTLTEKFQIHHILPKCLWPQYTDLKDHAWNSIKLSFKAHRLAHIILAKAFPTSSLGCSLNFFTEDFISKSKWFNDGLKDFRCLPEDGLKYNLIPGRVNIESLRNRTFVHKDNRNVCIKKEELEKYLDEGFEHRLCKSVIVIAITNGEYNTAIPREDLEFFLKENPRFRKGVTVKSERRLNNRVFNKCNKEIRLMPHEEDIYINMGWSPGRSTLSKNKFKAANKQINKNGVGKRVKKDELQAYLDDGWSLGVPPEQTRKSKETLKDYIRVYDNISLKEYKIHKDQFDCEKYTRGRTPLRRKGVIKLLRWGIISPNGEVTFLTMKKNIRNLGLSMSLFSVDQLVEYRPKEVYRTRTSKESISTENWKWFSTLEHPMIQETVSYNALLQRKQNL